MASDPEPHDYIALDPANRAVVQPDTDRVDGFCGVDEAETQTWVTRVLLEKCVGPFCGTVNFPGQGCESLSEPMGGPRPHSTDSSNDWVFFARNSSRASPASCLSSG